MTPIDFRRLTQPSRSAITDPRQLFTSLPEKQPRYAYARDVQTEVWDAWHARRSEPDLVIKMNTGGGKTVVGLLVLKSSLNEGVGPAVYVAPDNYLAQQVAEECSSLGIAHTSDPGDPGFLSGQMILIATVHRLFNGLSVFGTKYSGRPSQPLGVVLIDDAHACADAVYDQFKLKIPQEHPAYNKLIDLFANELKAQSSARFADIGAGDHTRVMRVPYWAWMDRHDEVLSVLHPHRDDQALRFNWPLVADDLRLCQVAVSANAIEIAPPSLPVEAIPSFVRAHRRIYLTATLSDDSVLVSHFGANPDSVRVPITPRSADDLGDRMILSPLEAFPNLSDADIQQYLMEQAKAVNVVVIVPSWRRAERWTVFADAVHAANTLSDGLQRLRAGHVGLVVLINKYDGIDLPDDACRILVLDGLPEARDELELMLELETDSSELNLTRQVQRIEQGMGRGIRSTNDHCVVLLLGSRLANRLHRPDARVKFSPATRAQLELASDLTAALIGQDWSEFERVIAQCLDRDPDWVAASRDRISGVRFATESVVSEVTIAQREAFALAQRGAFADAAAALRPVMSTLGNGIQRGALQQQAAAYTHGFDRVAAQNIQCSAHADNAGVLKPAVGVGYVTLTNTKVQGAAAASFLAANYDDPVALALGVKDILDRLIPAPEQAAVARFEQAFADLGRHLGFEAQQPDRDYSIGPDVLWAMGNLRFAVIECKSGATGTTISRHEIEQLEQSTTWFAQAYDGTCQATSVMVHPSRTLHQLASAATDTRVMTFERLGKFCDNVRDFAETVAQTNSWSDPAAVAEQLIARNLHAGAVLQAWTQGLQRSP